MRYIDAFNHFSPKRYFDALVESPAGQKDIGKRVRGIPALYDLELRLKVVDQFPDYTQILSLGLPMVDRLWGPDKSPEMAKIANDGLAEVCAKHPDRFVGYSAVVPMNAPEAAAKEAERALKNGAHAVQLGTNVNGKPIDGKEFWPLYETIEKSGKPILLHPARSREMIDYQGEAKSKYEIWAILGWPYETSCTMARLIFSGVTTRLPDLKILVHHLGAMIPFFDARLETGWATLGSRTSDEDYGGVLKMLGKPMMHCFKDFYADTALCGGRIGTVCGLQFFGADHVLFASDAPFGPEGGASYIRETMKVIAALDIAESDKEKICHRNAQALFKLP